MADLALADLAGSRRRTRRSDVQPDRLGQDERRRSAGLARRRSGPHRRASRAGSTICCRGIGAPAPGKLITLLEPKLTGARPSPDPYHPYGIVIDSQTLIFSHVQVQCIRVTWCGRRGTTTPTKRPCGVRPARAPKSIECSAAAIQRRILRYRSCRLSQGLPLQSRLARPDGRNMLL
jgi:hypothetical protein